jgi:hypothetical protein
LKFIEFVALPRVLRNSEFGFNTDKAFGRAYKICQDTLCRWKNEEVFALKVRETRRHWGEERTPDVILALYRKACKDGNAAEAKLWLQYTEGWNDKASTQDNDTRENLQEIRDNLRRVIDRGKAQ